MPLTSWFWAASVSEAETDQTQVPIWNESAPDVEVEPSPSVDVVVKQDAGVDDFRRHEL